MTNRDEYAKVYRVYLAQNPSDGEIGQHMIRSDERILIFSNGLIYAYQRESKARALYSDLDSYIKYKESSYLEPPEEQKFRGLSDCFYKEPVRYSDLLFSLCNTYDFYSVKELYVLIESINQLFNFDENIDIDD